MKKILSDCDGVLLDWNYSFEKWMKYHFNLEVVDDSQYAIGKRYGIQWSKLDPEDKFYLPKIFCNSSRIGSLKPIRDSVLYVRKLYEEFGITIDVITSLSLDPESVRLRKRNLREVFGPAIDRIVCLDTGADKDDALLEWKDSGLIWVEDKTKNAIVGSDMGLNSFLLAHTYNSDCQDERVTRVQTWKEIYDYVKGQ